MFASAIVGRPEVPPRLRQLLNVESGVNDGLALPVVLVLLAAAGGETEAAAALEEVLLGMTVGVVIPAATIKPEQSGLFRAAGPYERIDGLRSRCRSTRCRSRPTPTCCSRPSLPA